MEGSNFKRVLLVLRHMALRPRDGVRWARWIFGRESPLDLGLPWMSWGAIGYLNRHVQPGMRVFEWGGGGSTRYFLKLGCRVTTVESNRFWKEQIERTVSQDNLHGTLKIRLVPAETRNPKSIRAYIGAVHSGAPWDIIVIDGVERDYLSRTDCVREARGLVKTDGFIVLDDAYRSAYKEVPRLLYGYRRRAFRGLGPARLGVTQTDIYSPPRET